MTKNTFPHTDVAKAWFQLMAEAIRGTQDAAKTYESFAQVAADPAQLTSWLRTFAPDIAPGITPEDIQSWLEEWQRSMGVVPRARYLDLLEKHDQLQRRLEQAEETIATLRSLLGGKDIQQKTAQQVMDTWSQMLEGTLQMQSEWLRQWTGDAATQSDTKSDS